MTSGVDIINHKVLVSTKWEKNFC